MKTQAADVYRIDYQVLEKQLKRASQEDGIFEVVVNSPFQFKVETAFMFLGIIVLLQVNNKTGMIDRVALSNTDFAKMTTDVSFIPFEEIKIPVDHDQNIIARAIQTSQPQDTTDWQYLFTPAMTPQQARINQANAGIAYSAVYPLNAQDGGALIFSYFQYQSEIGTVQEKFMQRYSKLVDKYLARS